MTPFWVTAFLDLATDAFDPGVAFWRAVTGYEVSPARGDEGEFATLVPPHGDDFLRVQRLADGPDRIHLDLHVDRPRPAADRAIGLGATRIADHGPGGHVVLRSPAGLVFCFVTHPTEERPAPVAWPGGHLSLVDQVCIDVPAGRFDAECAFWEALTGCAQRDSSVSADFRSLERPPGQPLRFLLQRLGEREGTAGAHLDLATTDRAAETERHCDLGAEVLAEHGRWTVLADPTGRAYCITDRDPETGMLA